MNSWEYLLALDVDVKETFFREKPKPWLVCWETIENINFRNKQYTNISSKYDQFCRIDYIGMFGPSRPEINMN